MQCLLAEMSGGEFCLLVGQGKEKEVKALLRGAGGDLNMVGTLPYLTLL